MKRFFHSELEDYRSNLVLMGERAIELVELATRSLIDGEFELCDQVLERDRTVDELAARIDNEGIRYISLRSPVAMELRLLTIGMKLAHDLKRVGDEACSIARRSRQLLSGMPVRDLVDIPEMSELVLQMLRSAVIAFSEEDSSGVREIPTRDRQVDEINRLNYEQLTARIARDASSVSNSLDLIFISKSLERIGDQASTLADDITFLFGAESRHGSDLHGQPSGSNN